MTPKSPAQKFQRYETDMTTCDSGDSNISRPPITISQIEERLVRDDSSNELYMPLSSINVIKRKKELLYVPLDFENGLTIDAFVDSGAYVSAIAQKELDRIKQQSPSNILKIDEPKADHQGSKIPFTDFRWIGPYIVERVLPNNNYVVRKIGTNKTQILHRMRLRQFPPRQPIPNIPVTQREWQPDPESIIKHDDLYARAWDCEYDKPIFDSDRDNLKIANSPEVTVRSGEAADETRSTPGTIQEDSSDTLPHIDEIEEGTNTDHYMQPDADTIVEQIDLMPTNLRSAKYDLRHNLRSNCNDDYRY